MHKNPYFIYYKLLPFILHLMLRLLKLRLNETIMVLWNSTVQAVLNSEKRK